MSNSKFGTGFNRAFQEEKLSLGLIFPIESHESPVPDMNNQVALAQLAEQLGYASLWSRDVPLLDPSFGDAGQMYDPWVWLGYIAAQTRTIALATGSIILPLRPPVDLAKAAASVDQLSGGRLILGVATGDRPVEYSVYGTDFDSRDETFRNALLFIKQHTHRIPGWDDQMAVKSGNLDLLPKSVSGDIPLLVTGRSRQTMQWIAEHADGWLMYPQPAEQQQKVLTLWRESLKQAQQQWKPFAQSLYIDLTDDPDQPASRIHLGYRCGRHYLTQHLQALCQCGVNHVAFNLRFSTRAVDEVMQEIAEYVMPEFHGHSSA